MANILDPTENLSPVSGLKGIYTKLREVIRVLNTAVTNIDTNTESIDSLGTIPKIYKALLTQSTVSSTSGLLVVGKTYVIDALLGADDFANVGYVSDGVDFVATATTPTVWANSTIVINQTDSAPVAVVLNNTLDGVPVWTRFSAGVYMLTLNGAFLVNKPWVSVTMDSNQGFAFCKRSTDNRIQLSTFDTSFALADDLLGDNVSFMVEVYP